ncbi:RNA metabolism protein [Lithospermum erythrorhizon]|uniref:RNA metabolism protein n=1 Tax=Lithospermum erythrorhizon TaxID=34254 RepID=A0AAV3RUR7_LITER
MSQPPSPPSAATSPPPPLTLKRRREEGQEESTTTDTAAAAEEDVPAAKRRSRVEQEVVFRIVVAPRQIGKVIGRVGHRIKKIREETKATVKVADAVTRHEERVIIISSKDNDDAFCDAENGLHQIVTLILMDDGSNREADKIAAAHVPANTIRLLIAGSQVGSLIGVSGQNIENLRNSSGANITVLAENQLPLCASTYEGDRVVQISGDVPLVLRAVVEIGCQLRDNPPKQVISISPSYKKGRSRGAQHYVDPSSAEYVSLEIMIPEEFVGGLIGRCGSNISRIRSESGATIKVYGGKGEGNQRQIHLGGSSQQVALAKLRVDEYVYSQMMLQPGGQQPLMPEDSSRLFQGYGQDHGLYANSNLSQTGMMASLPPMPHMPQLPQIHRIPQMYPGSTTNQAPYYDQSYQPPHSYHSPM